MPRARFLPSGLCDVQAREIPAERGRKTSEFAALGRVRHEAAANVRWIRYGPGALMTCDEAARGFGYSGEDTMMMLRRWRAGLAATLLAGTIAPTALAQGWPDRTITAVVPFTAGAANDIVGRMVLDQVSKQVNQPIVVENRPGAGGAQRLHPPGALLVLRLLNSAAQDAALRHAQRFCPGHPARQYTDCASD